MDQLASFSNDGQNFYCFIQIRNNLFPSVPKSTVKSWLRELNIKCRKCTEQEREFFKAKIPTLSGAFGAMSSTDLQRLLEYSSHQNSVMLEHVKSSTSQSFPISTPTTAGEPSEICKQSEILERGDSSSSELVPPATPVIVPTDNSIHNDTEVIKVDEIADLNLQSNMDTSNISLNRECITIEDNPVDGSISAPEFMSGKATQPDRGVGKHGSKQMSNTKTESMLINTVTPPTSSTVKSAADVSVSEEPIDTTVHEQSSDGDVDLQAISPKNKGGNPRIRYSLQEEQMTPRLKEELKNFERFYSADINASRSSCSLAESSMQKLKERALCFLGFVHHSHPTKMLSLTLAINSELIEEFVHFLTKSRKLMASTVARSLSSIVSVIKFLRQNDADVEVLPEVIAIRNMQRQLSREETITRKRKREGFTSGAGERLLFSHILDVLRQLREQFHNTSGISSSRHLHDFTMLSLYIRALPGRSKELRTLRLIDNFQSEDKFSTQNVDELNALVLDPDGSILLIESDFKTVKQMGPSKLDLTDDEWLVYFIKTYLEKHRPGLLLGKAHDYVFFNKNGDPFLGSGSISKYLGDLFEREVRLRASTTKMRHAIVTYFMSLPESQNLKLRESLASLLKHSVRHQQNTYNDQQRQERTGIGRSFMRKAISKSDPFSEEDGEMLTIKSYSEQDLEEGDNEGTKLVPQIGDICALLDPASTSPSDAYIFVAKVLRYTPDKARVCLQEMEKVPNSTHLYRIKCSSTWWENIECLSYPIDIVYNNSEKAYELRTPSEQIYNDVMGNHA